MAESKRNDDRGAHHESHDDHGGDSDSGDERDPKVGAEEAETAADEDAEALEKSAANAPVVYKAIMLEGEGELERPPSALAWSGLAAGLSMGFSLVAEGLLRADLPDARWRPLVTTLGYPMGFLIVVLGRQQLFTENTLTAVLPLFKQKDIATLRKVARLWVVVLVSNLVGAAAFAWVIERTQAFDPNVKDAFLALGRQAMDHPFGVVLLRGIFAGWLIALMVWLLPVAEVARVWVIIVVTYIVGLGPSSHIVVGSVEAIYTVAAGAHSWGDYFMGYMIPSLLGNIIGGVALVAALNHAQVYSGKDDPS